MRRRYYLAPLLLGAMLLAACSNTTTTGPGPQPDQRGQWLRPTLPGLTTPAVASVTFASGNPQTGYACAATLKSTSVATATPVATTTATTAPSPTATATGTPTVALPGQPTAGPGQNDITNALFKTTDGGLVWRPIPLPEGIGPFICPLSALTMPSLNPANIFLLAARGSVDLANPVSITPGQLQYSLWHSPDGGQTWQKVSVPVSPNPLVPTVLVPYHIVMLTQGSTLVFANNYSGSDALFVSTNEGQSWVQRDITSVGFTSAGDHFAGFAATTDGTLLALIASPTTDGMAQTVNLVATTDGGGTWQKRGAVQLPATMPANAPAQLFTAGTGTIAVIARTNAPTASVGTPTPTVGPASPTTTLVRSVDGGATWSKNLWPSGSGDGTSGDLITQFGVNVAPSPDGDLYIAPATTGSIQNTTSFYLITASGASQVATPRVAGNTILNLAVSLVTPANLTATPAQPTAVATGTATLSPTATATTAPVATDTPAATGTPTPIVTVQSTVTVTPAPVPPGLPVLWTNFGPLSLFASNPDNAGFFYDILP